MLLKKTHLYLFILSIVFVACKAKKGITDIGNTKKMSIAKVIKKNKAQKSNFNTLRATLKITTSTPDKEQKVTASLRMQNNQKIWISIKKAGITGAKILITPTKVQYYNKLDKTYFDGDFSFISTILGTALNFNQIQALLLGNAVFTLDPNLYDMEILKEGYLLYPKQQDFIFEQFTTLNPSHFKIKTQEIAQPQKKRLLTVDYKSYQKIDSQLIPLLVHINTLQKNNETQIDINYKSVSLNSELKFPFTIPSGYKQITFE